VICDIPSFPNCKRLCLYNWLFTGHVLYRSQTLYSKRKEPTFLKSPSVRLSTNLGPEEKNPRPRGL